MRVIAGCVIIKDDKILMVKEGKESCYGQWNYPAGHVEDFEKISEGALRETFEETGCKVKLTGLLPIISIDYKNESHLLIRFTAEMVEENISYDGDEILDVKWIKMDEIKNMKEEELRGYETAIKTVRDIENKNTYPVEVFDNNKYSS